MSSSSDLFAYFFCNFTSMEEQLRQIAARLKGLRDVLNISSAEAAKTCGIDEQIYLAYELGEKDIPVGVLHRMSQQYGVELSVLLTGNEPRMQHYSVTRKNKGESFERTKAYKYQALAGSFINRKAEPFEVTVCPKPAGTAFCLNAHPGQEFNYVLEGRMQFNIDGKVMILEAGDSIYFNSGLPHGMLALDNQDCRFLALIF